MGENFGKVTTTSCLAKLNMANLSNSFDTKGWVKLYSSYWCMAYTQQCKRCIAIANITRPVNVIMGSMQ